MCSLIFLSATNLGLPNSLTFLFVCLQLTWVYWLEETCDAINMGELQTHLCTAWIYIFIWLVRKLVAIQNKCVILDLTLYSTKSYHSVLQTATYAEQQLKWKCKSQWIFNLQLFSTSLIITDPKLHIGLFTKIKREFELLEKWVTANEDSVYQHGPHSLLVSKQLMVFYS